MWPAATNPSPGPVWDWAGSTAWTEAMIALAARLMAPALPTIWRDIIFRFIIDANQSRLYPLNTEACGHPFNPINGGTHDRRLKPSTQDLKQPALTGGFF